ncbi:MAG: UDP-N-acetylmuramate--L-alanine ligase [Candidatus Beckwithbacteria bacterium]|nr:UDP-N-acetylmuramate--L-alanine ligase [Candidatus Beckwithbacteria bacterium]
MNLRKIKTIHFTGIKGVGMTALALGVQDLGKNVSGSDTEEIFPTNAILKQRQIKVKSGFSARNIPKNCDLLIYTGAHNGQANPEVVSALSRGIPVLAHSQALGLFSSGFKTLAVAGVGGKSTTSAILATILDSAGLKPCFCVGAGDVPCLKTPGRMVRKSAYFVAEADEYVTDPQLNLTPRFHYLSPFVSIITNIEYDHPDVYQNLEAIFDSFRTFIKPVPPDGLVVVNFDNSHVRQFIKTIDKPIATYGFSPQADWQIVKAHVADKKQFLQLKYKNIVWPELIINLPGNYNALNSVAAVAAAHHLGVSPDKIILGLKRFTGVKRRFEFIATVKGVSLYDDYAHHPTEIQAVLSAAKNWFPGKRLITIFQSHTYSRTKALLSDFARSFELADEVIINDIFPSAREKDNLGLIGPIFSQEVKKYHSRVHYCPGEPETMNCLKKIVAKNDVIFTLGAGNNWLWYKQIIKLLKTR